MEQQDSEDWAAYARIQEQLSRTTRVDSRAWGLEAALDRKLESIATTPAELEKVSRSAARKERDRRRLRRIFLVERPQTDHPNAMEARLRLRAVRIALTALNYSILVAVAMGYTYTAIAARTGLTVGALRVRVLRLRAHLRGLGHAA